MTVRVVVGDSKVMISDSEGDDRYWWSGDGMVIGQCFVETLVYSRGRILDDSYVDEVEFLPRLEQLQGYGTAAYMHQGS